MISGVDVSRVHPHFLKHSGQCTSITNAPHNWTRRAFHPAARNNRPRGAAASHAMHVGARSSTGGPQHEHEMNDGAVVRGIPIPSDEVPHDLPVIAL